MAREQTALLDGLVVGYGTRNSANPEAGSVHTYGRRHEVHVNLDFRAMPTAQAVAATLKEARIPSGSVVVQANVQVDTVFAGATTIDVGLKQLDGTAIGAATAIVSAGSLAAVGNVRAEDLDVEAGVTDAYVAVDTDSPATAGTGVLTVVYHEKVPASVEPSPVIGEI